MVNVVKLLNIQNVLKVIRQIRMWDCKRDMR